MSTVTEVRCPDCGSTSPYTDEDGCCKTCGGDCEVTTHQYGGVVRELREPERDEVDHLVYVMAGTIHVTSVGDLIGLRDAINAALHEYRYEWVPCDNWWADGMNKTDHAEADCPVCADHAEWRLEPGQVRVKCETCDAGAIKHPAFTTGRKPCPRIAEGRCKDGYAIKGVG